MTDTDTKTRDYRETLFLPKTDFPMRAGLPKREPEWIQRWDEMKLYDLMRADAKARGVKPWLLHDGPPYANGPIHLGTAMNKIVKDIIVRSRQMTGWDASYLPGWDCHGLPIEWKVEEEFRSKGRTKDDVPGGEFRAACRAYAAKWVEVQKAGFRRCGVEGEWDDPYLTMKPESEAKTVGEFLRIAMSGRLVRGAKPVMWSPVEKTALAEAEVEYHDRKVPQIWVKFPVRHTKHAQARERDESGNIPAAAPDWAAEQDRAADADAHVIIWTTTPWTIPANQAVSFNPSIEYAMYQVQEVMSEEELGFQPYAKINECLIVAKSLVDAVMGAAKVTKFGWVEDVNPESWTIHHPLRREGKFFQHDIPLLSGDHVTAEAGTGFVHTAPAHGDDDYNVWVASGRSSRDIRDIVDDAGCYRDEVPERLRGLDIIRTSGKKRGQAGKANDEVIKALAEAGNLLARGVTDIRDAHSWRSKAPVIRRATPQWFIAMDTPGNDGSPPLRDLALKAIDETEFFPATGRNRMRPMVETRPDWLVSRQRNWGVPLTIFVNEAGEPHTSALSSEVAEKINQNILAAISKGGVEAWFDTPGGQFFDGTGASPEGWTKVEDVLDVWFDSGTTHAFALRDRGIIDEDSGQADLYMEGSDQHRGWFQSSLLECCATRGMAPFRQVLTHGFIVDADGKKMSKSIGNTIEPEDFAKQYGIEILRLWTASGDYTDDLRISDEIIKGTVESYRRLRNTLRYLLGALDGFSDSERAEPADMPGLERWVLHRLGEIDETVRAAYNVYDFKRAMSAILNFCGVDLSAIYFDIRKDSLYCDAPNDPRRRAARTVMHLLLERLVTWLAPVMPFTTEEAFQGSHLAARAASVHLLQIPVTPTDWRNEALAEQWEKIFTVRRVVTGAIEIQRKDKIIGSSLEAAPKVYVSDARLLKAFEGEAAEDIFITSAADLIHSDAPGGAFTLDDAPGVGVVFERAAGIKCARSWKYFDPATADPEFPDITPRDAAAVKAWDAAHG